MRRGGEEEKKKQRLGKEKKKKENKEKEKRTGNVHKKVHTHTHKKESDEPHFLLSVFSPFWRENFLLNPGRKHVDPTIYFPFFPPNQTHSKKVFILIFSLKFSIHSISPRNKHTLREETVATINIWK